MMIAERLWRQLALWAIQRLRRKLEHRIDQSFDRALSLELDGM